MSHWPWQNLKIGKLPKIATVCFAIGVFLAISFNQNWFGSLAIKAQTSSNKAYYVSTNGDNNNPGTLEQPFRTIQKCAQVVVAGETCYIREGVYRESVKPAHSGKTNAPITFQPYQNESVTISGADIVTNWTQDQGSIYKAKMDWDLGSGNNQVFVDGKMMIEARWPNLTLDISHPPKALVKTASHSKPGERWSMIKANITDSNLTQPNNFWKGAKINFQGGVAYWIQTGTVTDSEKGKISFDFTFWGDYFLLEENNPYFLWGTQAALDTSSEWFFEPKNSTLYLWTPQNDNPNSHLVESKKRQVAFSLVNNSYITVEGLNLFASTIFTDEKSQNIILNSIKTQYVSHYTEVTKPDSKMYSTGLVIRGNNNELRNSVISFSAGTGMSVGGKNHKIYNNVVNDVCYSGYECAGIYVIGRVGNETSQNIEVDHNTVYNSGRHALVYNPLQPYKSENYESKVKITYNHLSNAGLQTPDGGVIYTSGNGGNVEIAYNWIQGYLADSLAYGKYRGASLYLDNETSNFIIHHNLVLDAVDALRINWSGRNILIYNNTLLGKKISLQINNANQKMGNFPNTQVINNIFTQPNAGKNIQEVLFSNNLMPETNPQFKNTQSNNYQLNSNSPAIDQGKAIPPYTDGYVGSAPDIGAYEYGKEPWKAGA